MKFLCMEWGGGLLGGGRGTEKVTHQSPIKGRSMEPYMTYLHALFFKSVTVIEQKLKIISQNEQPEKYPK